MKETVTSLHELANGIQEVIPSDDNVKLDMTETNDLIQTMKLSMLLEASIHSGKLVNYLKTSNKKIPLPYDLAECDPSHACLQRNVAITFGNVEFIDKSGWVTKDDHRYHLPTLVEGKWHSGTNVRQDVPVDKDIQAEYFAKYPLFELFRKVSPYNTIEKASSFFEISPLTFDPVKTGLFHLKPTIFHSTANEDDAYWASFKKNNPRWSDEALIEWELEQIIQRKPDQQCNDLYSSPHDAEQKQVYDFQTSSSLVQMKMIKKYTYTPTGTTKAYIPLTNWMFHGEPEDHLFTIPLPEKQPLYNLQYFDGCDFVVICPNIEIADKLQRSEKFKNVAFTSFVCNHGYYNQVDFSKLEEKMVVLLIVNHSGMEIEDAVVESKAFYTYLMDQEKKIKYKELSVIQTAVKYSMSGKDFHSMKEFVQRYNKPIIIPASTFVFNTEDDYNENYEAAVKRIEMRNQEVKPYWVKETTVNETEDDEGNKQPSNGPEQLMRGIIARGCITYIIGESGVGKSNLTASLCAYLVNTSQRAPRPFAEKLWTRCKIKSDNDRLKIVYLDFENNKDKLDNRWKNFVVPYLPDDSNERKACGENFIMESMMSDSTNYSLEENFEKLCKLLDEYTSNRGEKGQPIDILVIDTYWEFIHRNDTKFDVFRKLIPRYPQLAIVVQHHLKDGKPYGRADKLFEADTTVHLSRNGTGTLNTPFTIGIGDKHRMICCEEDLKPFQVMLNDEHHFVSVGEIDKNGNGKPKTTEQVDKDGQELIKKLMKESKSKIELAGLLGMSVGTLSNKLKE